MVLKKTLNKHIFLKKKNKNCYFPRKHWNGDYIYKKTTIFRRRPIEEIFYLHIAESTRREPEETTETRHRITSQRNLKKPTGDGPSPQHSHSQAFLIAVSPRPPFSQRRLRVFLQWISGNVRLILQIIRNLDFTWFFRSYVGELEILFSFIWISSFFLFLYCSYDSVPQPSRDVKESEFVWLLFDDLVVNVWFLLADRLNAAGLVSQLTAIVRIFYFFSLKFVFYCYYYYF